MNPPTFDSVYYRQEFGLDELRYLSRPWWALRFYARLAARYLRQAGGRRVLDLGCAHGYLLSWLEGRFETYGVDLSEYAVTRSRAIAPRSCVLIGNIEKGFPEELDGLSFDLILARYVFEHLYDPASAIKACGARLTERGLLLFSVPNTESPGVWLKGKEWFGYRDRTHVSLLAPGEWLGLTKDAGLVVERTFSDGLWDSPYIPWLPVGVQHLIFSLPAVIEVALVWPFLPVRWGENLIVVAKKKK